MTLNSLVRSVRPTGSLGVVGVFLPEDPKSPDAQGREGRVAFDLGEFWSRGQRMATGQTPVKAYNRYLCRLIHEGRAHPSFIVSHELPLEAAPDAYAHFDARENGWSKVLLKPQARAATAKAARPHAGKGKQAPRPPHAH
jgi:glutathione-independent formaldehyde dehydrogenase